MSELAIFSKHLMETRKKVFVSELAIFSKHLMETRKKVFVSELARTHSFCGVR